MMEYVDRDLDLFIGQSIMKEPGSRLYTSSMAEAWRLVKFMIQKHYV